VSEQPYQVFTFEGLKKHIQFCSTYKTEFKTFAASLTWLSGKWLSCCGGVVGLDLIFVILVLIVQKTLLMFWH